MVADEPPSLLASRPPGTWEPWEAGRLEGLFSVEREDLRLRLRALADVGPGEAGGDREVGCLRLELADRAHLHLANDGALAHSQLRVDRGGDGREADGNGLPQREADGLRRLEIEEAIDFGVAGAHAGGEFVGRVVAGLGRYPVVDHGVHALLERDLAHGERDLVVDGELIVMRRRIGDQRAVAEVFRVGADIVDLDVVRADRRDRARGVELGVPPLPRVDEDEVRAVVADDVRAGRIEIAADEFDTVAVSRSGW